MSAAFRSPWVVRAARRRIAAIVLCAILAVLSVWPEPYHASALLAPDDSAAGLQSLFSGGGGVNLLASLLGGRGTVEGDLLIARSQAVVSSVAQRLQQEGRYKHTSLRSLEARLRHKVDIESLRGSIVQIAVDDHDPALAKQIVADFAAELQTRLTSLSREQAVQKRSIGRERMDEAARYLDQEQKALNDFKAVHHFSGPDTQLLFAIETQATLQGQIEAGEATLATLQTVEGPENIQVKALQERVSVLKRQLTDLQSRSGAGGSPSLSNLNPDLTQYFNLAREERYAEAQYDIYKRYLDALTVQEVAAPLNMDVIDPPFIDPKRHFNALPLGLLVLVALLALAAEIYVPSRRDLPAAA